MPRLVAVGSDAASWSVASISRSHFRVSMGGPLRRRISVRSGSSPTVCGLSERVSESGLYCSMMVPSLTPVLGSKVRIAPFCSLGERLDMARASIADGCGSAGELREQSLRCLAADRVRPRSGLDLERTGVEPIEFERAAGQGCRA